MWSSRSAWLQAELSPGNSKFAAPLAGANRPTQKEYRVCQALRATTDCRKLCTQCGNVWLDCILLLDVVTVR